MYPQTRIEVPALIASVDYLFKVSAFNRHGSGPFSQPVTAFVGEAVPSGAPLNVRAEPLTSTSARLSWQPPRNDTWNGNLLGYRVYWSCGVCGLKPASLTVDTTPLVLIVNSLEVYTMYSFTLCAFNDAGNGPNISQPISVLTLEGIPDAPASLSAVVTSPISANISWQLPRQPRGIIIQHELVYIQLAAGGVSELRSITVTFSGHKTWTLINDLLENATYSFSIRSRTSVDWSRSRSRNLTIGPAEGSPQSPQFLTIAQNRDYYVLKWHQPFSALSPTHFIVQVRDELDTTWQPVDSIGVSESSVSVSIADLKPRAQYQFRVIATNSRGISYPSLPSLHVLPQVASAEGEEKPYYEQWWFIVMVALACVTVIVLLVSTCVVAVRHKGRNSKSNGLRHICLRPPMPLPVIPQSATMNTIVSMGSLPRNTLTRSSRSRPNSRPTSTYAEDNDDTFEMRETGPGQRSLRSRMGDSLRRSNIRSPPRPSPGSVNYSDDDQKTLQEDDSSSLTEKASLSSTDSRQRSEAASENAPPPPFSSIPPMTQGEAIRTSWHTRLPPQQHPQRLLSVGGQGHEYEYQPTGAQLMYTLNAGHVFVNNVAGSRAPLPGFSSFV